MLKKWMPLVLALVSSACSSGRNIVFVVDTSGSMTMSELMPEVRRSIRQIVRDSKVGDHVFLYTFDREPRFVFDQAIQSEEDKHQLGRRFDELKALGQWTNLVGALDMALARVVELQKRASRKTLLVLYTDGKQDLPAAGEPGVKNFTQLFQKYFKNYRPGSSWFIYYVELNEAEPELEQLLQTTGAGKVISRQKFSTGVNFTHDSELWRSIGFALAGLLVLGVLVLLLLPWFRNVALIPAEGGREEAIDLSTYGKKYLKRGLLIGSEGDVPIMGKGVGSAHVFIGVTWRGEYYLRPLGKNVTKVDGSYVLSRTFIRAGQRVRFGSLDFRFDLLE